MRFKREEKERAIALRSKGFSYSEILTQIPVAKSTLSLWLRSVGLAKRQKQRLTERRLQAALRGAYGRRETRLRITKEIKDKARQEIDRISKRELWLMGIMLYWAEGSKEKPERPGLGVRFINSDPYMVRLFLRWLEEIIEVSRDRLRFELYLHQTHKERLPIVKQYWMKHLQIVPQQFDTVYFKRSKIKTYRKNISDNYYGLVNVCVSASSTLNRRIAGWIEGVCRVSRIR